MAYTDPKTWATDELVTATLLNTELRDNLDAAFPTLTEWDDWTPTYTNLTPGSGAAISARYMQMGNIVFCRWQVILGTGLSVGDIRVTLPVTSATSGYTALSSIIGTAGFGDTGTVRYVGNVCWSSATEAAIRIPQGAGSDLTNSAITSTVPHTWAATDTISGDWHYESA
jgi:hypothetical protein